MSMVLTRSPLEVIVMNGGPTQKRRSARLSGDGDGDREPPTKKAKVNGATTTTIDTKQQDGAGAGNKVAGKKKRKEYEEEVDDFHFKRKSSRRKKIAEQNAPFEQAKEQLAPPASPAPDSAGQGSLAEPTTITATTQKKARRRFPTTPERENEEKKVRRSKRLSDENGSGAEPAPSSRQAARVGSRVGAERSPSPARGRQLTVEKKRQQAGNRAEQTKVMQIALPFADTPIQRRNKEMRKTSAEGHRRSSAGMRGKRASSVIDEGRGHEERNAVHACQRGYDNYEEACEQTLLRQIERGAPYSLSNTGAMTGEMLANVNITFTAMPHAEVPASEFFKHISADLTEPRRMRNLLGWCGTRLLPLKPQPPRDKTTASSIEFQAQQAARIIQEELAQDLMLNGMLSDWFSRDDSTTSVILLRKKANPRNITNTAKAEELGTELERLKAERAEWEKLVMSTDGGADLNEQGHRDGSLSPLHPEHLASPQKAILAQLEATDAPSTDARSIQQRLQTVSEDLEYTVDLFAHGIHALTTTRATAERAAEKPLADAAELLESRQRQRAAQGQAPNQMDALRGLARVLNAQRK